MELLPDLDTTSPEAIAYVARRRLEHEARQAELAGIAAATPGQEPHVNVPWTGELWHWQNFYNSTQTGEHNRDWYFPWVTTCQH